MNKDEIKAKLDELEVEYDPNSKKDFLEALLEEKKSETPDEGTEEKQTNLLDVVSKAVVKEEEKEEVQQDNTIGELRTRPYGTLTRGQRELLRQNSPEYKDVESGVNVKLNDRLTTEKRIVKDADNKWVSLFKGKTYSFDEEDYNSLKDAQVRVKTEATKDKCCGSAEYESVPLLVKADA